MEEGQHNVSSARRVAVVASYIVMTKNTVSMVRPMQPSSSSIVAAASPTQSAS
jgi:hypothetical protein